MTKEELEKVVQGAEYDFLRENPHLGSNIMFLTLGGSHAYGTNVPGSDVDVRGVTGDSKYDLLGFGTFEQVVEQSTDTTIYGFRKLVSLLINCNPNVIEMLGSKPDNYMMVSPEGQMLLDNKALFLSKKALYSFGGYANDQLRRLQMGLLQNDVNTDMKEEFALRSVQRVLSGPDLQHNAPAEAENHFNISIGNVKDEEIKRQLVVNAIAAAKKDTSIKRIIVVIPFNTITTQTASVLRGIVGEKNILENHSGFDFEDSKQGKLLQYASENWDIPIVVTTNVQFFESFFSNKPAKSRKLHNIADSVIIFDEVQQLPVKYLKPCIKCIESLAANFGARIVLSTATQPALEPYFETIKPREIIDDSESYVKPFRRCSIENIGTVTAKNLTERIQKHKQCLCVVNEKEEAKAIYTAIENGRCKNLYCLTTDITPYDREKLLRQIRQNLKDDEPCIVISTSLIESGVDVDFPYGYRELYGLDSILQTAGRVNRNGLRDCGNSTLFVFDGPQEEYRALRNGTSRGCNESDNKKSITRGILQKYDVDSPKAIHEYFSRLYGYKGDGLDKFGIVKMASSKLIPFQDISQKFKIIDEDTVTVIISQTAEASELVGKIRNQTATKDDIRKAGKYTVSVRRSRYDKYLAASTEVLTTKVCNDVEEPDICSLVDMGLYTNIGVIFDAAA